MRLIREEVDPFGIRQLEFVPGRDRLAMIQRILTAEAGLMRELQASQANAELAKSTI